MKTIAWALVVLLLVLVVQTWVYYPLLPESMASHFGAGGEADGWSSRGSFFILMYSVIGMILLTVGTAVWVVPRSADSLINLPNKQFWLAPERREESLAVVQRAVGWILVFTVAFLVLVLQMVIEANLNPPPHLPAAFLWTLGLYLVATCGAAYWLWRRFRTVPTQARLR